MSALYSNLRRKRLINLSFTFLSPADQPLYVADQNVRLISVKEVHSVVAASATLQLRKCSSGTAPASGTALLAATTAADSTINIPLTPALTTTQADRYFVPGQFLALDVTGTLTGYQGTISIVLEVI